VVVRPDAEIREIFGRGDHHGSRLPSPAVAAGGLAGIHPCHQPLREIPVGGGERDERCRDDRRIGKHVAGDADRAIRHTAAPGHAIRARSGRRAPVPVNRVQLSQTPPFVAGHGRAPALAEDLRRRLRGKVGRSWYVDETYIRVHARWKYLYRAIDRDGALVDVMLSEHRDLAAAKAFFRSAKTVTGVTPDRVTTDGHDAYPRAIRTELGKRVRHRTNRYLTDVFDKYFWRERDIFSLARVTAWPRAGTEMQACHAA
jgi:hypothetical protein